MLKHAHSEIVQTSPGPFVSDTSPRCIDLEGLERRRIGTRQVAVVVASQKVGCFLRLLGNELCLLRRQHDVKPRVLHLVSSWFLVEPFCSQYLFFQPTRTGIFFDRIFILKLSSYLTTGHVDESCIEFRSWSYPGFLHFYRFFHGSIDLSQTPIKFIFQYEHF